MDINNYIPERIKKIPTHMDYGGQKKAEKMFQMIILIFAARKIPFLLALVALCSFLRQAVGFVWGYICQQFSQTMYILIAGFIISCLLTLPPWGMYRKNPLKWQKPRIQAEDVGSASAPSSAPAAQKSKRKK